MAEALYTKYRPQVFEDVVGQEHIERTIKNAIEQDKVSHAYLFCGPRGTGKTTTARLLAKALLCEKGPTAEPDGTCEDCRLIAAGEHPDVYELDAASRTGVDNVREEIIGRVQFAPTRGRYKVYIIDEVHMLSTAAFNALLKTLEEPPSHVVFILATTDPQKVPETIQSRCQRFDFRRISSDAMVARLGAVCVSEGVEFEGEALDLIAHRAEGGLRNALTSLEQIIAFGEGKVTLAGAESMLGSLDSSEMSEIMTAIGSRDAAACFRWVAQYVETGADLARFTHDLAEHVRNLYVMSLAGADVALEVSATERRELEAELPRFGGDRLARLLGILGDLSAELKTSTNPRLSFEIALTRMVRPDTDLTLESLAERVEALESGYSATSHVIGSVASQAVQAAPSMDAREPRAEAAHANPAPDARVAGEGRAVRAGYAVVEECGAGEEPAAGCAGGASFGGSRSAEPATKAAQPAQRAVPASADEPRVRVAEQPESASAASASRAGGAGASGVSDEVAQTLRNEAALQRIWSTAIASLKKSKAAYGVLFLNTKAVFDEAHGMLVIEFPKENAFAFKAVQKPDVQDAVAAALAAACSAQVPFAFSQGPTSPSAAPVARAAQAASSEAARGDTGAPAAREEAPSAARQAAAAALQRAKARDAAAANARAAASAANARTAPAGSRAAAPSYPEPEQVPVDAYGSVPYDEVPYGDADVPFDEAPEAAAHGAYGSAPASSPRDRDGRAAKAPAADADNKFAQMAREAAARTAASRANPLSQGGEPDARTSASIETTGPSGEPRDGTFASSDDLAALLAAGGFAGAHVEEMRE